MGRPGRVGLRRGTGDGICSGRLWVILSSVFSLLLPSRGCGVEMLAFIMVQLCETAGLALVDWTDEVGPAEAEKTPAARLPSHGPGSEWTLLEAGTLWHARQ